MSGKGANILCTLFIAPKGDKIQDENGAISKRQFIEDTVPTNSL
jgi:hypothetical protein